MNVLIKGFKSREEAEEFIHWYEGSGEQEIPYWLECRDDEGKDVRTSLNCDCRKTYPLKEENGALVMHIEED